MIYTWLADVSALLEEETYAEYYGRLPMHRRTKADRLLKQEDKALSVGAWCLYEQMVKEYDLPENTVYNLSHSGSFCLCSVDDSGDGSRWLGCDLEVIRTLRRQVAERFFCEGENDFIQEMQSEEEQRERFYRLWVLKESFMKATRLGMKLDMKQFEIGFSGEDKPYLKGQPKAFAGEYFFKEYVLEGIPCRIAVCSNVGDFSKDIRIIDL